MGTEMPPNTSIRDQVMLIRRLNDIQKAMKAEFELSYWRKHGVLPSDAVYIADVRIVNGKEEIALK